MSVSDGQRKTIEFRHALMKRCPQFPSCSAPECPLDPCYPDRVRTEASEPSCTARLSTRLRIVEEAVAEGASTAKALRYGGRTRREETGRRRAERAKAQWARLPEHEREARRETLRRGRAKRRQARTSASVKRRTCSG